MSSWVMPVSVSWKLIGSPSSPGGSRGPGSAPGRAQGEHRTRACVQKEGDYDAMNRHAIPPWCSSPSELGV